MRDDDWQPEQKPPPTKPTITRPDPSVCPSSSRSRDCVCRFRLLWIQGTRWAHALGGLSAISPAINSPWRKHFVLVAGNIGAGKTSAQGADWRSGFGGAAAMSPSPTIPHLPDFYGEMRAAGLFHLQVFFLGWPAGAVSWMRPRDPRSAILGSERRLRRLAHLRTTRCTTWATWQSGTSPHTTACSIWLWPACPVQIC